MAAVDCLHRRDTLLCLAGWSMPMLSNGISTLVEAKPFLLGVALIFLVRELLQVLRKVIVERTCTTVERDATIKAVSPPPCRRPFGPERRTEQEL